MRFLSLFSGIEAASVAWLELGWECVGVAEIEPFPCAVLKHHYPDVPNLGDITKITEQQIKGLGHIDLIVGGFPCQDLSVAGLRKGLRNEDGSNTRSGLFFDSMRTVEWAKHHCGLRWLLIENVPGLYSSNQGWDFATVVGEITGASFNPPPTGWRNTGVAVGPRGLLEWATLDAQWFGVAQRRRRCFALADFGDWSGRSPILFERHSLQGHPAPRREAGEGTTYSVAPCIGASGRGFERAGDTQGQGCLVPAVANPLTARMHNGINTTCDEGQTMIAHTLRAAYNASEDGTGRGTPIVPVTAGTMKACANSGGFSNSVDHAAAGYMIPVAHTETMPTMMNGANTPAGHNARSGHSKDNYIVPVTAYITPRICRNSDSANEVGIKNGQVSDCLQSDGPGAVAYRTSGDCGVMEQGDKTAVLNCNTDPTQQIVRKGTQVRRLTVTECSRLQGFPDDYLLSVPWRGKCPPADGPMYKALGNSMAVPVMRWIGQRIQASVDGKVDFVDEWEPAQRGAFF